VKEYCNRLLISSRANTAEKNRQPYEKIKDYLFSFLDRDEVKATNNLEERILRPAVIARKISSGNSTSKVSDTLQSLADSHCCQ